jgi:ABC-2 type transport system permease protein
MNGWNGWNGWNGKLLFMVSLSVRQRLAERGALLGRATFYVVILFVFSRLWDAVLEGEPIPGIERHQLVWYLAITEWIMLSMPPLHTEVEDEVRRGDLVYRLARPVSYPLAKLAEAFGELLVRMAALGIVGFAAALVLAGTLPVAPARLLWLLPLGLGAGVLSLVIHFAIGLGSFWLHDCRPIHWVWQKAAFVLGGLLLPLELYPPWLRAVAELSPLSALLYGPGSVALGLDVTGIALVLAQQLLWTCVALVGLAWLFRRGVARLELGGG